MSHLISLLSEMRGRLGMYLGTTSLTRLAAFLRGYDYAVEKVGGGKADPLLGEFRDWIHRRFQTTKHSWEETILIHSADEADAVSRFWVLLEEHLQEKGEAFPPRKADAVSMDGNRPQEAALASRAEHNDKG